MKKLIIAIIAGIVLVVYILPNFPFDKDEYSVNNKIHEEVYEALPNEKIIHIDDEYTYVLSVKTTDGKISQKVLTYNNMTQEIAEYGLEFDNLEISHMITIENQVIFELKAHNLDLYTSSYFYIDLKDKTSGELEGTFSKDFLAYDNGLMYFYDHKMLGFSDYEHYIISMDFHNDLHKEVIAKVELKDNKFKEASIVGNNLEITNTNKANIYSEIIMNLETHEIEYRNPTQYLFKKSKQYVAVSSTGYVVEEIKNPEGFYIPSGAYNVVISDKNIKDISNMYTHNDTIACKSEKAPQEYLTQSLDRYLNATPFGISSYKINGIEIMSENENMVSFVADLSVFPSNNGMPYKTNHKFIDEHRFLTEKITLVGYADEWVSISEFLLTDYYKNDLISPNYNGNTLFKSDINTYYTINGQKKYTSVFRVDNATNEKVEIISPTEKVSFSYVAYFEDKIFIDEHHFDGTYNMYEYNEKTNIITPVINEYTNLLAYKDNKIFISMFDGIYSVNLRTKDKEKLLEKDLFGVIVTDSYIKDNQLIVENYTNTLDKGKDFNDDFVINLK